MRLDGRARRGRKARKRFDFSRGLIGCKFLRRSKLFAQKGIILI
jgi:hypothetical protein